MTPETLAAVLESSNSNFKPNIMEPDNIYTAYKEYKIVWEPEPVLRWEEWFGMSQANVQRYHRCVDTFRYIDRAVAASSMSAEAVAAQLTSIAHSLLGSSPRSPRDFVKNCMYFYFHPPKVVDPKRPPKCTRTQLEAAISAAGLCSL